MVQKLGARLRDYISFAAEPYSRNLGQSFLTTFIPVLGRGLVRRPLDEIDELGLGDGAALAEVVLGQVLDFAHDVVGGPLDPVLEGDVAL